MRSQSCAGTASPAPAVLAAAYLHDVVEDTDATIQDIHDHFGEETAVGDAASIVQLQLLRACVLAHNLSAEAQFDCVRPIPALGLKWAATPPERCPRESPSRGSGDLPGDRFLAETMLPRTRGQVSTANGAARNTLSGRNGAQR